jgi:hypothetical protein
MRTKGSILTFALQFMLIGVIAAGEKDVNTSYPLVNDDSTRIGEGLVVQLIGGIDFEYSLCRENINNEKATHTNTTLLFEESIENEIKKKEEGIKVKEDVGLEEWKTVFYYKDALAEEVPAGAKYKR